LIEEEHYEEEIDENNIISEVIESECTDGQTVSLATDEGPPSTIIHKSAIKKYVSPSATSSTRTPKSTVFNNNNNTIGKNSSSSHQYQSFIGRLVSKDNILLISQNVIEIGRNSSKSSVDFHVGKNSFVSRKHLILHYDGHDFNLVCASKNGVFIDDQFIRKSNEATRLPNS
jgi:FHA domain